MSCIRNTPRRSPRSWRRPLQRTFSIAAFIPSWKLKAFSIYKNSYFSSIFQTCNVQKVILYKRNQFWGVEYSCSRGEHYVVTCLSYSCKWSHQFWFKLSWSYCLSVEAQISITNQWNSSQYSCLNWDKKKKWSVQESSTDLRQCECPVQLHAVCGEWPSLLCHLYARFQQWGWTTQTFLPWAKSNTSLT